MNNIEQYYHHIEKPIINQYINNLNLKNLLELSCVNNLNLFKKNKNKWKLKDKRILIKECEFIKKQKIKEVTTSINSLSKNKSIHLVRQIKEKSDTIFTDIEQIDSLIQTIENNYPEEIYDEVYSN
jgi:hypothetical protein